MKTKLEKPVKKAPKKKVKKTKKKVVVKLDRTLQKEHVMITKTLTAIMTSSTMNEAAEKLKISRTAVYGRIDKYELRASIDALAQLAMDQLKMSSVKASETLAKALDDPDIGIKIDVAKDILNRVGAKVDNKAPAVALQVNTRVDYGSWGKKPVEDKK